MKRLGEALFLTFFSVYYTLHPLTPVFLHYLKNRLYNEIDVEYFADALSSSKRNYPAAFNGGAPRARLPALTTPSSSIYFAISSTRYFYYTSDRY